MARLDYDEMVRAMTSCDDAYDGKFYVGVISTGIYCLPSCPARTPLLKNVVFFDSREEAIAAGLRGCKRCKSEGYPDVLPDWLPALIEYMTEHKKDRLTEQTLMKITGVDISTIRRHFQKYLGITPLAFHRRLRLNHARYLIERGSDYLSAAYECGWESSSAFREAFDNQFGFPPGRIHAG
ncbi:MAG: Ada metal-binding domain-containing protein [candidate division Zixibacteria bacterium]